MLDAPLLLRNARALRSGARYPEALDIAIDTTGHIAHIGTRLPNPNSAREVDLCGKLVVPGLVDVHQHLDKTHTRRSVPNPAGTLLGAIEAYARYGKTVTHADIEARADRALNACVARGTVAIRTHVNIDPQVELRPVEALSAVRDRWRDRIRLQIVALIASGVDKGRSVADRLDRAVRAGADVIGGGPALSADPNAFIDELFDAAERHGLPMDLHLDEHLDANRHHFERVIERTRARGMQGRVTVSHCCALSAIPLDHARRICDGLADARIGVVTLPAANLFLQGREASALTPRGLTRVRELRAAGVPVACASDNTQDPFVPTGSGDMLEIARWAYLAGHLGSNELHDAFEMASAIPAQFMTLEGYGLREGARADLLISAAEDAEDLIASGPLERTVLFGGRAVAGTL